MSALISVKDLSIHAQNVQLLQALDLELFQDQPLTILGETGAGKSLLAQAIMGLLPEGLTHTGEVWVKGRSLNQSSAEQWQALWGRELVMLPQEPWHALDPLMQSGTQVAEVYQTLHGMDYQQSNQQAWQDLERVELSNAYFKRPGQLSGGMAQRVAIMAATVGGANIVLADEPTKGLDSRRRDDVVRLLKARSQGGGLLTITHDVSVARQLGGRIMVIKQGVLVEHGDAKSVLESPKSDYAKSLIAADPYNWPVAEKAQDLSPQLTVSNLSLKRENQPLFEGLSFELSTGEVLGLIGESGCGKSSLGDALLGLLKPCAGKIGYLQAGDKTSRLKLYQDPPAAFSSAVTLGQLLDDLVALHQLNANDIGPLMERLKLSPSLLERTSQQVSGGELQRFAILRTMLMQPKFLFADEPTSRLDPITAKEVTELLVELARERGCALILVTHNPELVSKTCDKVIDLTHYCPTKFAKVG
ncbi:ABC transporter ATP-binding protein [Paraferrimonas sedimenticola]|uniref:ABC transporter ATP-binding protein n=1 Tax=Paraferrimonas sedimenticola TaxID=375674 RepID=A0AA37RVM8_9GAMM|nr:ATP-binding cassette domain-containing protein [Paraferrimonas sedimenticola]GLP96038.1 ABC transporter ATP-binding protein [Paraferrimonas sedimenticola]